MRVKQSQFIQNSQKIPEARGLAQLSYLAPKY